MKPLLYLAIAATGALLAGSQAVITQTPNGGFFLGAALMLAGTIGFGKAAK